METLFIYFIKMIALSGGLFVYYLLFLKDKTFHHYNRFYLVFGVLFSLVLPLLKVSFFTMEVDSRIYQLLNPIETYPTVNESDNGLYYAIIFFIASIISGILLVGLVISIVKIFQLKKKYKRKEYKGISFYNTSLDEAPFSFFKNLFWKTSIDVKSTIGRQILSHEMVHIEQKHSYDKIWVELIQRLFWFNPFFYWIKKELNLIHEYLADHKAVKNKDTKSFAEMLLTSHFSGHLNPVTHPFLNSHLKKRLKMIQKSKTKYAYLRKLAVLPVLFIMTFAMLVNAKNKEIKQINQEVKKVFSEIKKDTLKPDFKINEITATSYYTEDEQDGIRPFDEIINKSKPSDVFMIEDKKVSKSELVDFYHKNYKDRNFTISMTLKKNDLNIVKVSMIKPDTKKSVEKPIATIVDIKFNDTEEYKIEKVNAEIPATYFVNNKKVSKSEFENFIKENNHSSRLEIMKSLTNGINSASLRPENIEFGVGTKDRHQYFYQSVINKLKDTKKKSDINYIDISTDKIPKSTIDVTSKAVLITNDNRKETTQNAIDVNEMQYFLDGKPISKEEAYKIEPKDIKNVIVAKHKKRFEIFKK